MAIDPTAPITPLIPATPVGDANDPANALLALARVAAANNASVLGEIAASGSPAEPGAVKAGAAAPGAHAPGEAPASAALSTAERMTQAVRSAAALAAPRQAGLAPAMANLSAAIALPETPAPVREAARAVLDKALPAGQPLTATALREAVQGSGVFLEARLARAAVAAPTAPTAPMQAPPPFAAAGGDMKAALLVLQSVVTTWLAKAPAVTSEPRSSTPWEPVESENEGETARPLPPRGAYGVTPRLEARAASYATGSTTSLEGAPQTAAPPATPEEPTQAAMKAVSTSAPAVSEPATDAAAAEESAPELPDTPPGAPPPSPSVRPASTAPLPSLLMVGLINEELGDAAPGLAEDDEAPVLAPRATGYAPARPQASPRPPPPYAGGPTTAQAATASDLPKDLSSVEVARRLLKDVGGAIARQELSQIASLPEGHPEPERPAEAKSSRWVFDLPFQTPQGVAVAQFEIHKDGGGGGADGGREVERTWRARFSLNVEPLGPVHVQIALTGPMTRVGLWAERPESMARLRAGEAALGAALRQAELTPEIAVHGGAPTTVLTAPGRFVDRET